ncbi:MAG: glycosyltransferase family 4 protein [Chloroflexota bacterium]|nr:glycosyltransferase family 4 protein [Chloroflexota bacterium]
MKEERNEVEILFVGSVVERKGVDILLQATLPLFAEFPNMQLHMVGTGDLIRALRDWTQDAGIDERVVFEDALSTASVPQRMATADVLVLPSRWDGWGIVVNEALSVGLPVIVSDRCGAADLIQQGINGYIFRSECVEDLRDRIRRFLTEPDSQPRMASDATRIGRALATDVVAPYLIACLRHMLGEEGEPPVPPWAHELGIAGERPSIRRILPRGDRR